MRSIGSTKHWSGNKQANRRYHATHGKHALAAAFVCDDPPPRAQWRRLPRRSATAGQRTAATSDEETAAAPEVGLGAGASAAKATPAKEDTATAATTATYKILEAMAL
jgi:hypothetical protein